MSLEKLESILHKYTTDESTFSDIILELGDNKGLYSLRDKRSIELFTEFFGKLDKKEQVLIIDNVIASDNSKLLEALDNSLSSSIGINVLNLGATESNKNFLIESINPNNGLKI